MNMDYWLMLMALACPIALARFAGVVHSQARIIERERARVDAAGAIDAMARANAHRVMELLMTTDRVRAARVAEKIEANNRLLDAAVKTLEQLIDPPEDRARLAAIKEARMQYLASLDRIGQLIAEGPRVAASAMLLATTLPALDRLIASVHALSERRGGAGQAAARIAAVPMVAYPKRAAGPRFGTDEAAARRCKRVANARAGGPDEWQAF